MFYSQANFNHPQTGLLPTGPSLLIANRGRQPDFFDQPDESYRSRFEYISDWYVALCDSSVAHGPHTREQIGAVFFEGTELHDLG